MKNKPLIVGIAVVIFLVISVITIAYIKNSNQAKKENESNNSQSPTVTDNQSTGVSSEVSKTGSYIDYSDDAIKNTKGTKVLFFHAPWCPQCRAIDNSIKSGKIPEGVTIIKTDYDSNQDLRKKYGVTLQTTMVRVDDDGNMVKKYTAYNQPTLQAIIDNVL